MFFSGHGVDLRILSNVLICPTVCYRRIVLIRIGQLLVLFTEAFYPCLTLCVFIRLLVCLYLSLSVLKA